MARLETIPAEKEVILLVMILLRPVTSKAVLGNFTTATAGTPNTTTISQTQQIKQTAAVELVNQSFFDRVFRTLDIWTALIPSIFQCTGSLASCMLCHIILYPAKCTNCPRYVLSLCSRLVGLSIRDTLLAWQF